MKVCIGARKKDNKYQYGLTVYSETGSLLYSSMIHDDVSENKFENHIKALEWGIKKIKTLTQNKTLSDSEHITLLIGSKTLYTWFEKEVAPEPYTSLFSNLLLEMSFIANSLEIIYSKTVDKKVLYKNTVEDKGVKVTDLFKDSIYSG